MRIRPRAVSPEPASSNGTRAREYLPPSAVAVTVPQGRGASRPDVGPATSTIRAYGAALPDRSRGPPPGATSRYAPSGGAYPAGGSGAAMMRSVSPTAPRPIWAQSDKGMRISSSPSSGARGAGSGETWTSVKNGARTARSRALSGRPVASVHCSLSATARRSNMGTPEIEGSRPSSGCTAGTSSVRTARRAV